MKDSTNRKVEWRIRTKQRLLELRGGKCELCGFDKPVLGAYTFHHLDPKTKEYNLSTKLVGYKKLAKEAQKCILLCLNCHAMVHDIEYEGEGGKYNISPVLIEPAVIFTKQCEACGETFETKDFEQRYCSIQCAGTGKRKISASIEELRELVKTNNNSQLARMFEVSPTAIRNFRKRHKI